jgi:hypothetical protein
MPASTPITSYPCLRAFVKRKAGVLQKVQDKSKGGDKKKKGGKAAAAAVAKASKTRAAPPYTVHNPE